MIATFVRFRSYLAPYRRLLAWGAFLATLDIGFGLAQPWPLKVVVDQVVLGHPPEGLLANLPPLSRQVELALIIAVLIALLLPAVQSSQGQSHAGRIRDASVAPAQGILVARQSTDYAVSWPRR